MPIGKKYTIYIPDELVEQWQAISNRSEWIQGKLRQDQLTSEYLRAVKESERLIKEGGQQYKYRHLYDGVIPDNSKKISSMPNSEDGSKP